jgi:hypothetical protein
MGLPLVADADDVVKPGVHREYQIASGHALMAAIAPPDRGGSRFGISRSRGGPGPEPWASGSVAPAAWNISATARPRQSPLASPLVGNARHRQFRHRRMPLKRHLHLSRGTRSGRR